MGNAKPPADPALTRTGGERQATAVGAIERKLRLEGFQSPFRLLAVMNLGCRSGRFGIARLGLAALFTCLLVLQPTRTIQRV